METLTKIGKENLLILMEKFKESGNRLNEFWNEHLSELDGLLDEDYPFEISFDDISSEVHEWVETVENKLKKEEKEFEFQYDDVFGSRTVFVKGSTFEEAEKNFVEIRRSMISNNNVRDNY